MPNNLKTFSLLAFISMASFSCAILTPALPEISSQLNLTHGQASWIITIFMLGYVFGQLFYGPVANTFGRISALRLGLFINFIGIIFCLISQHSYFLLIIGRFLTAFGTSAGLVCTFILINELYNANKAKEIMAYTVVSFTGGLAISVTLGGIMTEYFRWQDCFWILLIHCCLMFIATNTITETLKIKQSFSLVAIIKKYYDTLFSKQLIVFSFLLSFISFMNYGYSFAAPLIAKNALQLTPATYGYWNLCNMIGMFLSGFFGKILINRYEMKNVFLFGFFGMFVVVFSLMLFSFLTINNAFWFFTTTTLGYFFTGILFPCAAFYASNATNDRASASSMMNFLNMGGSMLVVALLGYIPATIEKSYAIVFFIFCTITFFVYHIFAKKFVQS